MSNTGIIVTNFGRLPVLKIFCAGIRRLREETGLTIPCVCVGEPDGANLCAEYGITHITYPNKPLTGKFNRACLELKGKVDALMVMGSDNVLATRSFVAINSAIEKGHDLVGLNDVYFYAMDDIHTGNLYYFGTTTVLGVGRTVSAKVLDCVGWQPWNIERDRAIDVIMLDAVRPYVKNSLLIKGEYVFDLKTNYNLNRIEFWAKKLKPLPNADILFNNIGSEETQLIKQYLADQK